MKTWTALLLLACSAPAQISEREFTDRRAALAKRIDSGVVLAFGERNPVSDFGPFYQLPSFHYLTNFDEPDAAFLMVVRGGVAKSTLFITPADPRRAFYYGWRPDSMAVRKQHGIDARSFGALGRIVDSLASSRLPFYTVDDVEDADFAGADSLTRGRIFVASLAARHPGLTVKSAHASVDQLRAKKSTAEIALLKRAAEISSEGHRAAMMAPVPRHEYELQAALEGTFTRLGAARPAYGSIVGSGVNGTQLHYMRDRGETKPGDLVVMDAAGEYEGYAADITRTIPVSGTFTNEQRKIYQLVRDAQAAAERNSAPGKSQAAAQDSSCRQAMFWMIHGISHGLGLAVHDPAQYSFGDRTYKPGDVFTIEPGIYVSSRMLDALPDTPRNRQFIAKVKPVVPKYENTGVRIEDDYVITETALERISSAPREIPEIEALMKRRARIVP